MLEALMAASPGYPSSEQLLEKAWDENTDPFTKTVAVAIGRLRYKLGPASPSGMDLAANARFCRHPVGGRSGWPCS